MDSTSEGCRQYCLVCWAMTWSRPTVLYVPGFGLCSGAPVSHMSEQTWGSAIGPFGWCKPPRKLKLLRKGARGSVDLPNTNLPSVSAVGNQLHSSISCCFAGSGMPCAVYRAQHGRGTLPLTSLPMASRTGKASATPPIPKRKARRSRGVFVTSLLEEQLARDDVPDHVAHPLAACL